MAPAFLHLLLVCALALPFGWLAVRLRVLTIGGSLMAALVALAVGLRSLARSADQRRTLQPVIADTWRAAVESLAHAPAAQQGELIMLLAEGPVRSLRDAARSRTRAQPAFGPRRSALRAGPARA